jgi:phosphoribosyl-ATP pyrophosphohydrolase/phosphoribosyl-AMP cyclohydrolase
MQYDERGLVPAVVQDGLTGEVRMVAWMSREALSATEASGKATFYSRSRQKLWVKGESSGNTLHVRQLLADCDLDTLLVDVDPAGPSCHTGQPTCFFREPTEKGDPIPGGGVPVLVRLERTIEARVTSHADQSYTRSLLDRGSAVIADKIREEADELGRALVDESDERVASEAADVLFHVLVGLRSRNLALRAVLGELERRMGTSGIEEKRARIPPGGESP